MPSSLEQNPPTPLNKGGYIPSSLEKNPPTPLNKGGYMPSSLEQNPPTPLNKGGYVPPFLRGVRGDLSEEQQNIDKMPPIVYVGDTVADMYTVEKARSLQPNRTWIGVGVLPPHVQETAARRDAYAETLRQAGASIVLSNVEQLSPSKIQELLTILHN